MTKWMNAERWQHLCVNGTEFSADRCDFRNGVTALVPGNLDELQLMQDTAEMIGFHATNVRGSLNGFAGYDRIRFKLERA